MEVATATQSKLTTNYLMNRPINMHIFCRLIGKYGMRAKAFMNEQQRLGTWDPNYRLTEQVYHENNDRNNNRNNN